eukprot:2961072-Prymnesium_polylepis.1
MTNEWHEHSHAHRKAARLKLGLDTLNGAQSWTVRCSAAQRFHEAAGREGDLRCWTILTAPHLVWSSGRTGPCQSAQLRRAASRSRAVRPSASDVTCRGRVAVCGLGARDTHTGHVVT